MNNVRKSTYNLLFSLVSQLVTIALGIILPRIILVGYGSEVNGLFNSVTQFISYLIVFEAGIQSVATKSLYNTIGNQNQESTNQILSAVNKNYKKIGCLYCFGLLVMSAVYPLFVEVKELSWLHVFIIVFFSGFSNVIAFFFQAKYKILLTVDGRAYIITNLNTIISVLNNVLKIVLLQLGFKIYLVIILSFFVSMIQTIFIHLYIKKKYKWIDLNATPDYGALNQSKDALVHQISGLVFSNTDVLLLTIFCDLRVVSVYAIYKLIIGHISSLLAMPFTSCSFALGQAYNVDREQYKRLLDSIQVLFSVLIFSVLTVTYYLILPFISLYTADVTDISYIDRYLPLLFVGAELLNLIRVPTRHTVNCAGHFKETLSRTIIETLINLIVSIVGVVFLGIYGVLIGTIAALGYRTIDFIVYANKVILKRSAKQNLLLYMINFVFAVGIVCVLNLFKLEINSYFDFIKVGVLVTPPVLLAFILFNFILFKRDFKFIIKNIKGKIK